MRSNLPRVPQPRKTHEGAPAVPTDALSELRRTVMACLLWEDSFYESGQSIGDRIKTLCSRLAAEEICALAHEARSQMNLRHVPLLLLREVARKTNLPPRLLTRALEATIQRADEITEFLAIYWRDGRCPISKQVKLGLSRALNGFSEYEIAKYDRESAIKLRDVAFLIHAKPLLGVPPPPSEPAPELSKTSGKGYRRGQTERHAQSWLHKLIHGQLPIPDTWEVALSGGADKKETFERLLKEKKLGYLALLRNLRNMEQAGVDHLLIGEALLARRGGAERVLPFRYIAAARAVPRYEHPLEMALLTALSEMPKLKGRTLILVDNSGSMYCPLSQKSDMTRADAAAGVAMIAREICEDVRVWAFSYSIREIPARRGFALRDAIQAATPHGGTELGGAVRYLNTIEADRIIVITDEQSHDAVPRPLNRKGYLLNVASYQNGVGFGDWTTISGWSESVIKYILALENEG